MEMRKTLIDTNIYSNAMRGDSDITGILKKWMKSAFRSSLSVNCFPGLKVEQENPKTVRNWIFSWILPELCYTNSIPLQPIIIQK